MIDVRVDTIIYQSQIYYRDLVNELVDNKKLGKALDSKWEKADLILAYLEALNYRDRLTDTDDILNVNQILYCLIKLCELYQYPVSAPIEFQEAPDILFGIPGADGTGIQGIQGETGLATDFQVSLVSVPTVVDYFDVDDAKGARWDYVIIKSTGEQRSGSIVGTWSADGSSIEFNDDSTDDIVGTTEALEFDVQFSGGNIQLLAVPTSGIWTVVGSRYFIPNNGNGTGPISDVLADGSIFIGNASNLAQARVMSGDGTISNTGVFAISNGVIVNADINASAGIDMNKLQVLNPSMLVVTSAAGVITTLASPTLTQVGYLGGGTPVTSSVQTQINGKLTDPMTSIGDVIIRNGSNVTARLAVGTSGQVFTISGGVPSWQTPASGFSDPMTSVGDVIIRNSGNVTARLAIGSSGQVLTVSSGKPVWATPASGFADPMTTIGDIMMRNGSNVTTRLGIGTSGQALVVNSGVPSWQTIGLSGLTAGRVTLSASSTTLTDSADLTYASSILTVGGSAGQLNITGSGKTVNLTSSQLVTGAGGTTFAVSATTVLTLSGSGVNITANSIIPSARIINLTGYTRLLTVPTIDSTLTQILARDSSTGEIKYRNVNTLNSGNSGGWGPVTFANVTGATNVTNVLGTGSYSVVGEVVHVFGYLDVTVTSIGAISFSLPLAIPSDSLYGGGGEATIAGVGSSGQVFSEGNKSWFIRYNATYGSRIFVETANLPVSGTYRVYFTYMYRRIAV
jgi:hypothetical protein